MELPHDWEEQLGEEFMQPYFVKLQQFLEEEYRNHTIYPAWENIFAAFEFASYENTKVVILGQDPYHGAGQAHGLSFSVQPGVPVPPSLKNIFKEMQSDLGHAIPNHGHLTHWAKQGVLLLNTVLTVRDGSPNSHKGAGWEKFTDKVIDVLNQRERPVVYILWGRNAHTKMERIDRSRHYIIYSAHPSPLSARNGFFGSKPFSAANDFLRSRGENPIDWGIPH